MLDKESGCLKIRSFFGIEILLHWTFPIGGILVCGFFGGGAQQIIFFVISYSLLIFIHELGHFIPAKFMKLKVHAIKISGAGGFCYCEPPQTYSSAFIIYSGGLLFQLLAFLLVISYIHIFSYPSTMFGNSLILTFTAVNLIMFLVNIFPGKLSGGELTDGLVLWKLFRDWRSSV